MIANAFIVLFLIGMAYWWGMVQGLFSAFLHLVVVIFAGALAFALWEPIAQLLLKTMPMQAWGVSLIAPFVLILIVVRIIVDKMVPKNLHFPKVVDNAVGALVGVISGTLTAGIAVLGIGFLSVDSVGGYTPLMIQDDGKITASNREGNALWVPVDSITAGFFSMLSNGSFHSGHPMSLYLPPLNEHAATHRLKGDPFSSNVALPGSVALDASVYITPTPVPGMPDTLSRAINAPSGAQLVLVGTQWTQTVGTFDGDSTLRVPPAQIRLISWSAEGDSHVAEPLGWSKMVTPAPPKQKKDERGRAIGPPPQPGPPELTFIKPSSTNPQATAVRDDLIRWAFVVPRGYDPTFLIVRKLRLVVTQAKRITSPAQMVQNLGKFGGKGGGPVSPNTPLAKDVNITTKLSRASSKNFLSALNIEGKGVLSGSAKIKERGGVISKKNRIADFYVPGHQDTVRIVMNTENAIGAFGRVPTGQAREQEFYVLLDTGDKVHCAGFILWTKQDKTHFFNIVRPQTLKTGIELPIDSMSGSGDELFLYFIVPRSTRVKSFHVGDRSMDINMDVPAS